MKRINTANRAEDLFGAGKDGFRQAQAGVSDATYLSALFCNHLQEAVVRTIEAAGLALSDTDFDQFPNAIAKLIEARVGDYSLDTGTANNYVIAMNPPITAYKNGTPAAFRAANACTGACTLNAGPGAVALLRADGTALQAADISASMLVSAVYDQPSNAFLVTSMVASQTLSLATGDSRYVLKSKPLPAGLPGWWATPNIPSWALVRDGSAVPRASYPDLFAALCPKRSGNTTAGSKALTGLPTTTDMYVGMPLEGAGIPAGATVESITSLTAVNMTANATATAAIQFTLFYYGYGAAGSATTFGLPDDRGLFERGLDSGARAYDRTTLTGATVTSGSTTISNLPTTKGMFIGMVFGGTGYASNTATIVSINSSSSITVSVASTVSSAAAALTFTGGQIGNERSFSMQGHWHQTTVNPGYGYQTGGTINDFLYATGTVGSVSAGTADATTDGRNGTPITGPETRGRNRAYLPIITF